MARSKKRQPKRRATPSAKRVAELLDERVREIAQDFACSLDVCAHFAEELQTEIDGREPMLPLNALAIQVWNDHREQLPELVGTLEALFAERRRHDAAIVEISNRLWAMAKDDRHHADISPIEPIEEAVRGTLIASAWRLEQQIGEEPEADG
jgi:hypothetical protein